MGRITGFTIGALLLAATGAHADALCFDEAGALYGINPIILRAIAKVESNYKTRAINWNRNGTYDFGVMQINSSWASSLGMEHWNTLGDSCSNIKTGAMILASCMEKYGYTWEAIGCYNSQTPDKRDKYARMVFNQLQRIEQEDRLFGKNLEAAVRDRVDDLVAASRNGQARAFAATIPLVPAPTELLQTEAASPAEDQAAAPDLHGVELSATSLFEGAARGM